MANLKMKQWRNHAFPARDVVGRVSPTVWWLEGSFPGSKEAEPTHDRQRRWVEKGRRRGIWAPCFHTTMHFCARLSRALCLFVMDAAPFFTLSAGVDDHPDAPANKHRRSCDRRSRANYFCKPPLETAPLRPRHPPLRSGACLLIRSASGSSWWTRMPTRRNRCRSA